jgi:uncharacterized protein YbaR (Trm112 family)
MADLVLLKAGGMLYGADEASKAYISRSDPGIPLKLKVSQSRKTRKDVLNRLSHLMYSQAAKAKTSTPEDEKAFCKYRFGIPVLISPDYEDWEETRDYYERLLRGFSYEDRIARMHEGHRFYVPVTSLMSDDQIHDYINRCVNHYALHEGIAVLLPKEHEELARMAR